MASYLVLCVRRDAVVVMDNKYFITHVSVHITIIALVSCIFVLTFGS